MTLIPFVNPSSQRPLFADNGYLIDPETNEKFPVVNGIPRFCPSDNYSSSFGYQWNIFDVTQLDSHSGSDHSFLRFYYESGWRQDELSRCSVLEAGSGAGRFSEVFLRTTTGTLHSIDYSTAVDANRRNNARYGDRLRLAQASIYEMPFPDESFDKVFCFGVLQHTPSFETAVAALIAKTKIGGEVIVDFYPIKGWYTKIHAKYIFRPFTKRLPKPILLRLISANIGWMLALYDFLIAVRLGVLTRFIPITGVRAFPNELNNKARREWAIMDTFDGFSPDFDNPQKVKDVERMFTSRGCEVTFAGEIRISAGVASVVRAVRRS